MERMIEYASRLAEIAINSGLSLKSRSEKLDSIEDITPPSCIDGSLLSWLSGEPADFSKERGQRADCNCTVSRDIGSYNDMLCFHGCLYFYANPVT